MSSSSGNMAGDRETIESLHLAIRVLLISSPMTARAVPRCDPLAGKGACGEAVLPGYGQTGGGARLTNSSTSLGRASMQLGGSVAHRWGTSAPCRLGSGYRPRPSLGGKVRLTTPLFGYVAAHEQFAVPRLLDTTVLAEQTGFDAMWASDHFHPWQDNQGHARVTLAALIKGAIIASSRRATSTSRPCRSPFTSRPADPEAPAWPDCTAMAW
jgi:hypothetical protein